MLKEQDPEYFGIGQDSPDKISKNSPDSEDLSELSMRSYSSESKLNHKKVDNIPTNSLKLMQQSTVDPELYGEYKDKVNLSPLEIDKNSKSSEDEKTLG